jgi:hypothetical protein
MVRLYNVWLLALLLFGDTRDAQCTADRFVLDLRTLQSNSDVQPGDDDPTCLAGKRTAAMAGRVLREEAVHPAVRARFHMH